ncbi:MAG TPA: MBL fold metallo-hydrolase [Dongiaceae bacterium]|nr:MBL fold metallo-hydrolase [Dongiaceae bacterium]
MRLTAPALALALALVVSSAATARAETAAPATSPDSAVVILLGTGTPVPLHTAQGPATIVRVGARLFLFDAGPGVERQIEAAGLPYRNGALTAAFLTHLHSDHTLGLPDLIFTSWVMGRRQPLVIVGPPGTRRMTDHIAQAWSEDIAIRTDGLEHESKDGWRVAVHETHGGIVYDSAGVRIRAFPVKHGSWHWAFGYRIDAGGRAIVISGDTAPSESLVAAARGADLLIHEVYPAVRLRSEARPGGDAWPNYMHEFHTSDRELGALCARAQPRQLVLYHIVRMGGSDEELLAGIRAGGYTGPVAIGHDLERY